MFKAKNAMISMAVVALLAACGGGGGGDDDNTNPAGNPPATQPDNQNPGNQNPGNQDPGTQTPGAQNPEPTADAQLASGKFEAATSMVMGLDDTRYTPLPLAEFIKSPTSANQRTVTAADPFGYGLYGQALGENAPLESIGLSVVYAETAPGAATSVGRVAFELQDQTTGTADPERALRILVDKVTYNVSATGVVTVSLAADSKVYVYVKNGAQSTTVTTAAVDLVKAVPNLEPQDPNRISLVLDVDKAVGDALAAATPGAQAQLLDSVKTFTAPAAPAAPFRVSINYSNLDIEDEGVDLAGPTISVNNSGVAGVRGGSGVTGYLQVPARAD